MGSLVLVEVFAFIGDLTNEYGADEFGPFDRGITIGAALVGLAWRLYYWGGKEEPLRGYLALTPEEYMRDEPPSGPEEEDFPAS